MIAGIDKMHHLFHFLLMDFANGMENKWDWRVDKKKKLLEENIALLAFYNAVFVLRIARVKLWLPIHMTKLLLYIFYQTWQHISADKANSCQLSIMSRWQLLLNLVSTVKRGKY